MPARDPGATLRALHRPGDPFVLANAWDRGSARILAALGAQAIGTTSAGFAFTRGLPDGARITLDETLAHAEDLVADLSQAERDQIMAMKTTFTPGHYRRRVAGVLARRLVTRLFEHP